MEKNILYFERTGKDNTEELLTLAKKHSTELKIDEIVIATSHGGTALRAKEVFGKNTRITAVTICEGYRENGWCIEPSERKKLEESGVRVLTCIHGLGDGVASSWSEKVGGVSAEEVVRDTLYRFCQSMKVCVEIVLMAADAGLIKMEGEVMAIAGTAEGADTCIIVKPTYPRKFHELEIREIVAKPRNLS